MTQYNIIPELNYWIRILLRNCSVYDTYHDMPVPVSSSWRCSNSVIELLFNENFNPDPPMWMSSSSSSSEFNTVENDNDRRYIYKYRRCNLNSITDKTLLNRIQIYRWNSNIFVANSDKFLNILDMTGSLYDPEFADQNVTLLYDVSEQERSPYITYDAKTHFSTNYPLYQPSSKEIIAPAQPPIINEEQDVFNFNEQDLDMLDLLYDFKTGYQIDLTTVNYNQLTSCISKLIFIYLDALINNNFSNYNSIDIVSNGFLCSLYEKHVLNILYMLKQKQYCINFNEKIIVNEEEYQLDEDMLMAMKCNHLVINVSQSDVNSHSIILEDQSLPWQRKDFTIFKDGIILEPDTDYIMSVNKSDIRNPFIKIDFIQSTLINGENLKLFWSYIDPYSCWSQQDS